MGSEPTTVDCTMYGMVLQMVVGVREDCVYRHLLPFLANLVAEFIDT
jgi:hypothetical protein